MGKGENACNQHFLLFQQCFLPIPKRISVFKLHLFCCLQVLSIWTSLEICRKVKSYLKMAWLKISFWAKINVCMLIILKKVHSINSLADMPCPDGSVVSAPDSWPGGCEFDPRLRRLFFPAYFHLSPLQKHLRKVVGDFGKKSCISTGVRKPGNTCASLTAMIWP